jgi:hypothetical protein
MTTPRCVISIHCAVSDEHGYLGTPDPRDALHRLLLNSSLPSGLPFHATYFYLIKVGQSMGI